MSGLNYLEAQNDNMYALKSMGSTFSDAVIGMAEAKSKRQQIANQMIMDQAYLGLARQKEARDTQLGGAQVGHLGAETSLLGTQNLTAQAALMQSQRIARMRAQSQMGGPALQSLLNDPTAGGQMMTDLRGAGVAPEGAFDTNQQDLNQRLLAALSGQLYGNASMSPGAAEGLSKPIMSTPGEIGRDPLNPGRELFNNPYVMTPYQGGRLGLLRDNYTTRNAETERHHQEMEDVWNGKLGLSGDALEEKKTHDRATENKQKALSPLRQRLEDLKNKGKGGVTNTVPETDVQGFTLMMNPAKQIVKVPNGAKVPQGYTPVQ